MRREVGLLLVVVQLLTLKPTCASLKCNAGEMTAIEEVSEGATKGGVVAAIRDVQQWRSDRWPAIEG
jgi:hypothetical protein